MSFALVTRFLHVFNFKGSPRLLKISKKQLASKKLHSSFFLVSWNTFPPRTRLWYCHEACGGSCGQQWHKPKLWTHPEHPGFGIVLPEALKSIFFFSLNLRFLAPYQVSFSFIWSKKHMSMKVFSHTDWYCHKFVALHPIQTLIQVNFFNSFFRFYYH